MILDAGLAPLPARTPQIPRNVFNAGFMPCPAVFMPYADSDNYWAPTPPDQLGPAWLPIGEYHTQERVCLFSDNNTQDDGGWMPWLGVGFSLHNPFAWAEVQVMHPGWPEPRMVPPWALAGAYNQPGLTWRPVGR